MIYICIKHYCIAVLLVISPFSYKNTMKLKFKLLFEWASAWFLHLTEIYKDVISVGLIVFGAFVAGARDLSFDAYGYAVVFMSNIATAIYLATIARIGCIPILLLSHIKWNFIPSFLPSLHIFLFIWYRVFLSGKTSGLNSFGLMWCNGKLMICIMAC